MYKFLLSPINDVKHKQSSLGFSYLELDGLRGIAVLIVLMSHTSAFGMYGQGSLGVLLFFFLSGLVLTLPYVDEPSTLRNRSAITKYFLNRILRIVPAYWGACLIIYLWMSAPLDWLLWNISFIKGWNHFWSVAEEVRFYLLFPFVVVLLSFIRSSIFRLGFLCGLILLSYTYKDYHQIDMMVGKSVSFYFWMFLGGMFAAFVHKARWWQTAVSRDWVATLLSFFAMMVLLALVLASTYMIENFWSNIFKGVPEGFRLNGWSHPEFWFFAFTILFLAAISIEGRLVNRFLTVWFLRHIGLLSYSIYIIHMSIRFKISQHGVTAETLFFTVLLSSYCFAYASYIVLEKPFLMLKKRRGNN